MCSRADCQNNIGKYIRFQTPFGYHEGIIERVQGDRAIIMSPKRYIPAQLATQSMDFEGMQPLDLALAWGYPGAGYGRGYGLGGRGGYGGWGGYAWGRWAVSFLTIYVLWGLLW